MWPPSGRICRSISLERLRVALRSAEGGTGSDKRREGQRDAGAQLLLAVRHFRRHRAQEADLHRQRFQEGAVERELGALQHDRGMLQPGDDAPCRDGRVPGDAGNAGAVDLDPVGDQRARVGGGELGAGGAHMAQPAEAVQRFQPLRIGDVELERRLAAGLDQMAGQRKAAVIDLERDLRVGEPEVRRRDQHALGRAALVAPMIDRPGAQPAPRAPPQLARHQRPQTRGIARSARQKAPPTSPDPGIH